MYSLNVRFAEGFVALWHRKEIARNGCSRAIPPPYLSTAIFMAKNTTSLHILPDMAPEMHRVKASTVRFPVPNSTCIRKEQQVLNSRVLNALFEVPPGLDVS